MNVPRVNPVQQQLEAMDPRELNAFLRNLLARVTTLEGTISGKRSFRRVTSGYTVVPTDDILLVDSSVGPLTLTLPDPSFMTEQILTVRKTSVDTNNITVGSVLTIKFAGTSRDLYSDGTNWWLI